MTELESMTPWISGAPICAGEASPLRVATGGNANCGSKSVAAARPPAQIDGAMASVVFERQERFTLEPNRIRDMNFSPQSGWF